MNENQIALDRFSNPDAEKLYKTHWPNEPHLYEQYSEGRQCGGCTFFAPFNADWGLCCCESSRHRCETVFEHFTCASFINEGWGPHSFTANEEFHCRCGGLD